MKNMKIEEYLLQLASKEPVPGGGAASALGGAIGVALGSMVGNLTLGKKKYAQYENDIRRMLEVSAHLQREMTELIQKDADAFEPIAKVYRMPKETEEQKRCREKMLQESLMTAAMVPFTVMQYASEAADVLEEMIDKGSVLAVSDIGVGAAFLRAASDGAALNVYINTKLIKERGSAEELNQKTMKLQQEMACRTERLYQRVKSVLV